MPMGCAALNADTTFYDERTAVGAFKVFRYSLCARIMSFVRKPLDESAQALSLDGSYLLVDLVLGTAGKSKRQPCG